MSSKSRILKTGPRGGQYYVISSGRIVYVGNASRAYRREHPHRRPADTRKPGPGVGGLRMQKWRWAQRLRRQRELRKAKAQKKIKR